MKLVSRIDIVRWSLLLNAHPNSVRRVHCSRILLSGEWYGYVKKEAKDETHFYYRITTRQQGRTKNETKEKRESCDTNPIRNPCARLLFATTKSIDAIEGIITTSLASHQRQQRNNINFRPWQFESINFIDFVNIETRRWCNWHVCAVRVCVDTISA